MANSAKRDPNGTWHIQFRYKDWMGTIRKTSRKGFKTKKEAEEWLNRFLLQQAADPGMFFKDFWEIYKADMRKRLKETTMTNKEYVVTDKLLPYFGNMPLNQITAATIR